MLYLAEVQKKTGFISSGKPEFKLLACQRSEHSWSNVNGEETLPAPDDASYNAGALVMVEVSGNRQVQRHYEAGRTLTSILQNFSNLSKKSKTQEEEIEQWKQSLTFQSQELNRRELELEARQEQVEQAEADIEQIDAQRQELEQLRQTLTQQQEDLNRKTQDLEGAWAHLNGEMRRLEEQRAEGGSGLDPAQVANLQGALSRLTEAVMPVEALREPLTHTTDGLNYHQNLLGDYRQSLENQRQGLEHRQQELDEQARQMEQRWTDYRQAEAALVAQREDLKLRQQAVKAQQEQLHALSDTLQTQTSLHKQIYDLLNTTDKVRLSKKIDVAALEAMDVDQLQATVNDLEKDLEKMSRFVSDQEEELALELQALNETKAKMEQANEFDRMQIETEMAEEQDRYQMLNETLVGQRRNLLEREEVLSQHQAVLWRRQGLSVEDTPASMVNLEPLLNAVDGQRQQTIEAIQGLEAGIKQAQEALGQLRGDIEGAEAALMAQRSEIEAFEAQLRQQQQDMGSLVGKLAICEELLNPAQESVNGLRLSLENLTGGMTKLQEVNDYQLQAIAELRQVVGSLGVSQVATS